MTRGLSLRTALVQGRLAYAMRGAAAARSNEWGLQIFTLPQLAARLAGGLKRAASRESIEAGIIAALGNPERLKEFAPVREMPGMTRALDRTLRKIWRSGFDLRRSPYRDLPRVRDLMHIEDVVRETLESGELLLPDLERLARAQIASARALLGPITIEGVHAVDPLWRPLLNELQSRLPVTWRAPAAASTDWFMGDIAIQEPNSPNSAPSAALRPDTRQVMLSTARLSSQGKKVSASSLLPAKTTAIYRDRIPRHAFSEPDRLLARPQDIEADPQAARAAAARTDWSRKNLTPHDGMVGQSHPLLAELLARPQSPTSLSLLLRDPLAYVWYYALGWRDLVHKERALTLPADDYGRLVHELLKHASRGRDFHRPTCTRSKKHSILPKPLS